MRKLVPHLEKQLSLSDLEGLHRAALQIIEEIGIKTENQDFLSRLAGKEGIHIQGERIRISPDLVNQYIEEYRAQDNAAPVTKERASQITLKPYDYASYIVDLDTDIIRPVTETDLIKMTKLVDSMQAAGYPISGGCPGFAQDLPEELRTVDQYRLSIEYSRSGREADLISIPGAEAIYRMTGVMGELPLGFSLFILSPLRLDDASLERLLYFLDRDASISIGVAAMPLLGATTPISLAGALAQSIAEMLAGLTLMKLIGGNRKVGFTVKLFAFDMKHSNISLGAAEEMLLASICKEVTDFYQGKDSAVHPYIFSMGKYPNQQSAAEKAAGAVYKALAGARVLTCGGSTGSTIFSPVQLVLDCEIVAYVNRILRGFELDDPQTSLEAIRDCYENGLYLGHETTVKNHRSTYWNPRLFEHVAFQARMDISPNDLQEHARRVARERIACHDFQMEEGKFGQIEEIYAGYKEKYLGST
jgi:trimethylamine--corrinoid protein Co-methyltransferase